MPYWTHLSKLVTYCLFYCSVAYNIQIETINALFFYRVRFTNLLGRFPVVCSLAKSFSIFCKQFNMELCCFLFKHHSFHLLCHTVLLLYCRNLNGLIVLSLVYETINRFNLHLSNNNSDAKSRHFLFPDGAHMCYSSQLVRRGLPFLWQRRENKLLKCYASF